MPLSEHVYFVAVMFKMTEWVEQWICLRFFINLEHSSTETIWMIQKASAMGNWWLAASSGQCTCSCIMYHAVFWWNTKSPGWLNHTYSQDLVPCDFWLFPKLKSPLRGKRFQTISEIQENMLEQLTAIGRTVWGPKVPTLKGTKELLCYVQCFLYPYLL